VVNWQVTHKCRTEETSNSFCQTLFKWFGYENGYRCCDRKSRAACAQSFAPWQQATIEFTRRDHYYCLFAPHIYIIVLRAHPVRGESHIQRNANGEVATQETHVNTPFNSNCYTPKTAMVVPRHSLRTEYRELWSKNTTLFWTYCFDFIKIAIFKTLRISARNDCNFCSVPVNYSS